MKAATGELNLTVITLIAIGLVITFFTTLLWPQIKNSINGIWGKINTAGQGELNGEGGGSGGATEAAGGGALTE